MATSDTEMIAFSRAFRGYHPQEVDDYLVQVSQYAQQLADRAMAAERLLEQQNVEIAELRRRIAADPGAEIPARLAQILTLAEDEAHDITEHARAQERAITDQAFRNAEQTLRDAAAERVAIEQRVRQLSTTRAALLDDLRDLSAHLARAADQHEAAFALPELEPAPEPLAVFDAEAAQSTGGPSAGTGDLAEGDADRTEAIGDDDLRVDDPRTGVAAAHE